MANQIPLATGTSAAGGVLVPEILGEALLERINRQNAALSLADVQLINSNRETWPVYKGRPTVSFVGEAGLKPVTGAEFGSLTVNVKKIAGFVVYTEEMLEDARIDPQVLVNDDMEEAFADFIDANLIGTHAGAGAATFSTGFDAALANTTQLDEYGATADAMALGISAAMERVEANGYEPNGIIVAFDAKRAIRDARDSTGQPLYREGFAGDVPSLEGLRLAYTTNLDGFPAGLVGTAGSPAKIVGIVGDFRQLKVVMRRQLSAKVYDQAVLQSVAGGAITHNLAQENKIAVRWELRMGAQIFDPNRSFSKIVNAS